MLKIDAYQIAGTKSKLGFFLIIITNTEKLIGIVKATRLPNKVPEDIESPIIIVIPDIAKTIEIKPINEIFYLRYKKPNSAKNIVCVLIIKTTLATDVFIIANTKAMKLKDITKPPNNAESPDFLIILIESFL